MISMPQFCKYRSPEKMRNLRRGLFIPLKSTLLCGISTLLAAFLNFLLGSAMPGYFSVLFTGVKSDIPSPASSLHVSQNRVSQEETSWRLPGYTPIHADLCIPFMGESLCAGHTLVSQCSDTLAARVAAEVTFTNLHSLYTLEEGRTDKPKNSKICV